MSIFDEHFDLPGSAGHVRQIGRTLAAGGGGVLLPLWGWLGRGGGSCEGGKSQQQAQQQRLHHDWDIVLHCHCHCRIGGGIIGRPITYGSQIHKTTAQLRAPKPAADALPLPTAIATAPGHDEEEDDDDAPATRHSTSRRDYLTLHLTCPHSSFLPLTRPNPARPATQLQSISRRSTPTIPLISRKGVKQSQLALNLHSEKFLLKSFQFL